MDLKHAYSWDRMVVYFGGLGIHSWGRKVARTDQGGWWGCCGCAFELSCCEVSPLGYRKPVHRIHRNPVQHINTWWWVHGI